MIAAQCWRLTENDAAALLMNVNIDKRILQLARNFFLVNSNTSTLTYLSGKEWQHLSDDGIESLAYLCLFMHLHIQAIRHLIVLRRVCIQVELFSIRRTSSLTIT